MSLQNMKAYFYQRHCTVQIGNYSFIWQLTKITALLLEVFLAMLCLVKF